MGEGVVVRPDQVSLGVLVHAVPRDAVDEAVAVCGVREKRSDGKLPAHVITYLTLGLALFPEDDYVEVATKVTGSLDRWGCWDAGWTVPTASAITQARKRLGRGVFSELFERTCGPVAGEPGPTAQAVALGTAGGSFLRRWRLLAIDGFEIDVPDSTENAAEFGYAGSGVNRSAFPKARVVALAECGTHAFVAAEVDAYRVGEKTLAQRLYPRLRADELLTAGTGASTPGRPGIPPWRAVRRCCGEPRPSCAARGAGAARWDLPHRLISPTIRGRRRERLLAAARNGADLSDINAVPDAFDQRGLPVIHLARVIEYDVPDRDGNGSGELIVVLSTITDPADARADELAAAYHQRWEEETANDQLKTHLRGPGRVLRSRLPDLLHQEIWAYLIVHHAISALTAKASARYGLRCAYRPSALFDARGDHERQELIMEWYLKVLRQYADFTGRARRKEYWMFTLVSFLISLVLAILDGMLGLDSNVGGFNVGLLGDLYALAVLLPTLAVGARRLHDIGRSGWWLLLGIIPVIGWIVLIVFFATDGQRQPNAYGPDPKTVPGETAVVA